MSERDALILQFQPLAHKIAGRFRLRCPTVPLDALEFYAQIGLIRAADSWDATRAKFITWAWRLITHSVVAGIQKEMRAPFSAQESEIEDFPHPRQTVSVADAAIDARKLTAYLARQVRYGRASFRSLRIIIRYYEGSTLGEIATLERISEGRASQILHAALDIMREVALPKESSMKTLLIGLLLAAGLWAESKTDKDLRADIASRDATIADLRARLAESSPGQSGDNLRRKQHAETMRKVEETGTRLITIEAVSDDIRKLIQLNTETLVRRAKRAEVMDAANDLSHRLLVIMAVANLAEISLLFLVWKRVR